MWLSNISIGMLLGILPSKMKTERNISHFTLSAILFALIFFVQACGPQLKSGNGGSTQLTDVEDLNPDDVFLDLCFGNDMDDDGVCDEEEDPECIDDPYCEDDADLVIDGLNGDYKNGGAMGRWLTAIGGIAAAGAVTYGLLGQSGLLKKKGMKKWGWLHQLIKDDPDKDGIGFLRVLKDSPSGTHTLEDDFMGFSTSAQEIYNIRNGDESWMTIIRELQITDQDKYLAMVRNKSSINGANLYHANGLGAEVSLAGKKVLTCVSGKRDFIDAQFQESVQKAVEVINDSDQSQAQNQQFTQARVSVQMNKSYLHVKDNPNTGVTANQEAKDWFKKKKTETEFRLHCSNTTTGGIWVGIQLKDSDQYFVNPIPTTALGSSGYQTFTNGEFVGYYIDYLLQMDDSAIPAGVQADSENKFTFRRYSPDSYATSALFNINTDGTLIQNFNNIPTNAQTSAAPVKNRAKLLLGFSPDAEIKADLVVRKDAIPPSVNLPPAEDRVPLGSLPEGSADRAMAEDIKQKASQTTLETKIAEPQTGVTINIIYTDSLTVVNN
ncbi:MAG: hypothetical protein KDD46_05330 [Bdellovibrionales bacterium]|nr:hypothetical protein [Bdellovibrionales bacterium]